MLKPLTVKAIVVNDAKEYGVKKDVDAQAESVHFGITLPFDGAKCYAQLCAWLQSQTRPIRLDAASFVALKTNQPAFAIITLLACAAAFVSTKTTTYQHKPKPALRVDVIVSKKEQSLLHEAQLVANAQTQTRLLQDLPSATLNPTTFTEQFKKLFSAIKTVKFTVLDHAALVDKKMGLILGVNRGSKIGAKLLVADYCGDHNNKHKVAFIGKGICFDSGGMNLKPRAYMRHMKHDMTGAATVLHVLLAIAKAKLKVNVVAVAPVTENLLSNAALRPDDILTAYDKTTVEIEDTDAEGRLVLADAIAYAVRDLKVAQMVTVATLTGTIISALGSTFSGCFTTTDCEWDDVLLAARLAGENVWRMPLHDDYTAVHESKVADWLSCVSKPGPDASYAAAFLNCFTSNQNLIHFDIAGTAEKDGVGLGVLVRTLFMYAKYAIHK